MIEKVNEDLKVNLAVSLRSGRSVELCFCDTGKQTAVSSVGQGTCSIGGAADGWGTLGPGPAKWRRKSEFSKADAYSS